MFCQIKTNETVGQPYYDNFTNLGGLTNFFEKVGVVVVSVVCEGALEGLVTDEAIDGALRRSLPLQLKMHSGKSYTVII